MIFVPPSISTGVPPIARQFVSKWRTRADFLFRFFAHAFTFVFRVPSNFFGVAVAGRGNLALFADLRQLAPASAWPDCHFAFPDECRFSFDGAFYDARSRDVHSIDRHGFLHDQLRWTIFDSGSSSMLSPSLKVSSSGSRESFSRPELDRCELCRGDVDRRVPGVTVCPAVVVDDRDVQEPGRAGGFAIVVEFFLGFLFDLLLGEGDAGVRDFDGFDLPFRTFSFGRGGSWQREPEGGHGDGREDCPSNPPHRNRHRIRVRRAAVRNRRCAPLAPVVRWDLQTKCPRDAQTSGGVAPRVRAPGAPDTLAKRSAVSSSSEPFLQVHAIGTRPRRT